MGHWHSCDVGIEKGFSESRENYQQRQH